MENMPRSQIEQISSNIFEYGDIIAKHGTSIKNALSIINTGLDFNRTSYVIQKSKNIESLCGYGWKENGPNDSANVIILVPREFFMDMLFMSSEEEYDSWIQNIKKNNYQEDVLDSVTTFVFSKPADDKGFTMGPVFNAHVPNEFIYGSFIWCNGKTYLNLGEGESPLDNLTFVPNKNFYMYLQDDKKTEFLRQMREKLGISCDNKRG